MNPGNWVWIAAPLIWIGLILIVRGPKGLRDDELSKEGRVVGDSATLSTGPMS